MTTAYQSNVSGDATVWRGVLALVLASAIGSVVLSLGLANEALAGWHLAPIVLNAILTTAVAVWRIRSMDDLISAKGAFHLFIIYFIGIAPALHIYFNFWLYLGAFPVSHAWTGWWSTIQLLGFLVVFLLTGPNRAGTVGRPSLDLESRKSSLLRISFVVFALTFAVKLLSIAQQGGLQAIVESYSSAVDGGRGSDIFEGAGPLILIGDMSLYMFSLTLALWVHKTRRRGLLIFLFYFASVLAFSVVFSGLRGGRGAVVISLMSAAFYYHYMISRLTPALLLAGGVFLAGYMTVASWYKFGGLEGIFDPTVRERAMSARQIEDDGIFVALRDFSRADTQSFALARVVEDRFPLSLGRSYLGAITYLIPSFVFQNKPPTFALEKTRLRFGGEFYESSEYTRLVFGQFTELHVNFGAAGIVMFFVMMIAYLNGTKNIFRQASLPQLNFAKLIAPYVAILPIQILTTDSNVLAMLALRYFGPLLVIYLVMRQTGPVAPARRADRVGDGNAAIS